jgi:hypothetical protein
VRAFYLISLVRIGCFLLLVISCELDEEQIRDCSLRLGIDQWMNEIVRDHVLPLDVRWRPRGSVIRLHDLHTPRSLSLAEKVKEESRW